MSLFLSASLFVLGCSSASQKTEVATQTKTKEDVSKKNKPKPSKPSVASEGAVSLSDSTEQEASKTNVINQIKVEEPIPAGQKIECKKANDVRSLTKVISTDKSSCRVVYRKFNHSRVAAESQHGTSYCDKVIVNIKSNLEKAGYVCE